jgi:hypothetical protein
MKKVFIVLTGLLLTTQLFADSVSERLIRKSDLLTYSLSKVGVKSLKFKMRVQGLKENLNKRKNFGKIDDLYFQVSWNYPKKLFIDVHGLPKGFKEVKEQLKMAVYSRLPLLFPVKKQEMLNGYVHSYDKATNTINAKDPSGKKALNQMKIVVTPDGLVTKIEGMGISGNQSTSYEGKVEKWSKEKFAYNKINITINAKSHKTVINHDINFKVVRGIGVPATINSQTKMVNTKDGSEKLLSSVESAFFDYVINGAKE